MARGDGRGGGEREEKGRFMPSSSIVTDNNAVPRISQRSSSLLRPTLPSPPPIVAIVLSRPFQQRARTGANKNSRQGHTIERNIVAHRIFKERKKKRSSLSSRTNFSLDKTEAFCRTPTIPSVPRKMNSAVISPLPTFPFSSLYLHQRLYLKV